MVINETTVQAHLRGVKPEKELHVQIKNRTVRRLVIKPRNSLVEGLHAPLIISALGKLKIEKKDLEYFSYQEWERLKLIQLLEEPTPAQRSVKFWNNLLIMFSQLILSLLTFSMLLVIPLGWLLSPLNLGLSAFGIVSVLVLGIIWYLLLNRFNNFAARFRLTLKKIVHFAYLLVIVIISLALPCVIVYFGNGGETIWKLNSNQLSLLLIGRGAQIIFIAIASLTPGLMYFLYARQHLDSLKEGFFKEILLLDPHIVTLDEAMQRYQKKVDEAFGSPKSGLLGYRGNFPVVLSTILIVLGWLLVLNPFDHISELKIQTLFMPRLNGLFEYGFLGAYFFTLNMVFRRYLRADLTAQAYSHVVVRILITTVLNWAIQLDYGYTSNANTTPPNPVLVALAFIIGVIPETGVTFIQQTLKKAFAWLDTILSKVIN